MNTSKKFLTINSTASGKMAIIVTGIQISSAWQGNRPLSCHLIDALSNAMDSLYSRVKQKVSATFHEIGGALSCQYTTLQENEKLKL